MEDSTDVVSPQDAEKVRSHIMSKSSRLSNDLDSIVDEINDSNYVSIDSLFETLSNSELDSDLESSKKSMGDISRLLYTYGFDACVTEFSHFVYADLVGESVKFRSVIYGNEKVIDEYVAELKENIEFTEHMHDSQGKGPLVPSQGLYHKPLWVANLVDTTHTVEEIGKEDDSKEDDASDLGIRFSDFPLSCSNASTDREAVSKFIEGFHRRVAEKCVGIVPSRQLKDILIIPFKRLEVASSNSEGEASPDIQGGALICIGSLLSSDDSNRTTKKLLLLKSRLENIATSFLLRQEKHHLSVLADQYRQMDLIRFRRGAIHEARTFARTIESMLNSALPHITDSEAILASEAGLDTVKVFRKVVDVLTDTLIPVEKTVISASDMEEHLFLAKAFLWHTFQNSRDYRHDLKTTHLQDIDAVASFLSQFPDVYRDQKEMIEKIEGEAGLCIIGLRNLLENAINGCGDRYTEEGLRIIPTSVRPFDVTTIVDQSGELIISNSCVFSELTYEKSWTKTKGNEPVGIYMHYSPKTSWPPKPKIKPLKVQATDTELSLKGAKFAQVLLESLGLTTTMERRLPNGDIEHPGTTMFVKQYV